RQCSLPGAKGRFCLSRCRVSFLPTTGRINRPAWWDATCSQTVANGVDGGGRHRIATMQIRLVSHSGGHTQTLLNRLWIWKSRVQIPSVTLNASPVSRSVSRLPANEIRFPARATTRARPSLSPTDQSPNHVRHVEPGTPG